MSTDSPEDGNPADGARARARTGQEEDGNESERKKKRKKLMEAIAADKPITHLGPQTLAFVKKIIDSKIFPYSKFLTTEKEVEAGYLQLVFIELKWNSASAEHHVQRSRAWRYLVDYIMKRCADRRAAAIAAIKKACVGK